MKTYGFEVYVLRPHRGPASESCWEMFVPQSPKHVSPLQILPDCHCITKRQRGL